MNIGDIKWNVFGVCILVLILFTSVNRSEVNTWLMGITIDPSYSAAELVTDVFAVGECETIENINSFGDQAGIGYFDNASDVIGLDRGIILSTGNVEGAVGPNNLSDQSISFGDNSGDPYLNGMANQPIRDAVGIEFDFQSLDSIVTFRYVFASEEYCEFANSDYNDVFGFFISGPGINGNFANNSKNIALIPGTNDFVSINSVNNYVNSDYYIGNERPEDASTCNIPFSNSPNLNLIEYDGFTTVLTAEVKLLPCENYHIRLVIGDVKDNYFDSAVFLEAGSFDVGGKVEIVSINDGIDNENLIEGCSDGYFHFARGDNNINNPLTVAFDVLPTSTAIEGVDFEPLPDYIVIPAGETYYNLPVYAINDTEVEPTEYIQIALDIPCACYEGNAEISIIEPPAFEVELPQIYVCPDATSTAVVEIDGGVPPFTYLWSDGSTTPQILIEDNGIDFYSVVVTDNCGHVQEASSSVLVEAPPAAYISGDIVFCEGDTAHLEVQLDGVAPWTLTYTINGQNPMFVQDIYDTLYLLPVWQEGIYEITQVEDVACSTPGEGSGSVNLWQMQTATVIHDVSCNGEVDGSIAVTVTGDQPPFSAMWNTGEDEFEITNLSAGTYILTIEDSQGCTQVRTIQVAEPAPLEPIEVDCDQLLRGEVALSATGGTSPYLYAVDGQDFESQEVFDDLNAGEYYMVTIQDANGCEIEQQLLMPMPYNPMFTLPTTATVKPAIPLIFAPELTITEDLIDHITWTPSGSLSCGDCLYPELTTLGGGSFTMEITDVFGCTESHTVQVIIDPNISIFWPTAFSPNNDNINDIFSITVHEAQVLEVISFQVFDRWGGLVHEAKKHHPNNERLGWDGTVGGTPANIGVYVFFIELLLFDNTTREYSGTITLIR